MGELFMLLFVPFGIVTGIASYNGETEVLGLKVIPLTPKQTTIYWCVIGVLVLHFLFNRRVRLKISKHELVYKRRLILGIYRRTPMAEITTMKIKRLLNLAESPENGMDVDSYVLKIYRKSKWRIIIRGLSQEDCETIQAKIKAYRKQTLK